MTLRDDDSLMLAYVYGELSDEDAHAFEQRLDGDAGLRAEVEGLLATREMLGEDARYGTETGLDLPPSHLTDAILRAEALARPAEIRQAAIRQGHGASGSGGFLARIQLWLVGGGLAVTATAALFLVAKDGSSPDAEMMPQASPVAVMAEEAADADQKANPEMAGEPLAEAEPARRQQAARTFGRPQKAAPAAKAAQDALQARAPAPDPGSGAVSGERQAAVEEAEQGEAEASKAEASKDDAVSGGLLQPPAQRIGAGDGEGFALDLDSPSADVPAAESRIAPSLEQKSAASGAKEKAVASSLSFADDESDAFAAPAGRSAEAPADGRAQKQAKAKGDSLGGAGLGTGGLSEAKPTAGMASSSSRSADTGGGAPAPARAAPRGPPALPEVARRELAKKRAARSRAPNRDKSVDTSASKAQENNRFDELQLSLVTAERELSEGRALDALDMFTSVAQQDPRGALVGVVPYVGQMRALSALGRHREVLAILPTVKRPGIKAAGVAEGILVAARSAEALAQTDLARQLYRELLVVKERRKDAEAGLARLDAQVRVRSKASAPAEASSADEPAAASEPRGKN